MSPNFALIFPFQSWENLCAKIVNRSYAEQRIREKLYAKWKYTFHRRRGSRRNRQPLNSVSPRPPLSPLKKIKYENQNTLINTSFAATTPSCKFVEFVSTHAAFLVPFVSFRSFFCQP